MSFGTAITLMALVDALITCLALYSLCSILILFGKPGKVLSAILCLMMIGAGIIGVARVM